MDYPSDSFSFPPRGNPPGRAIWIVPGGELDKSLEHVEGNLNAGKPQVAQIIGAIKVLDIDGVVVAPACRPSLIEPEPIAAVLEAVVPADHLRTDHVERVAVTEMGTVTGVRNATIMATATVGSNGLFLLPSGLLRLLCALLWLSLLCALLWLGFLRALLRLRFLRPLLWLRLLCPLLRLGFLRALLRLRFLRPLLWLRLLCALLRLRFLRPLLWLRFLGVLLRLRLVLRRLSLSTASALFLLAFLCYCRNGGSEKH